MPAGVRLKSRTCSTGTSNTNEISDDVEWEPLSRVVVCSGRDRACRRGVDDDTGVGHGSYELLLHDHEHGLVDGLEGDGISVGLGPKGFDESARICNLVVELSIQFSHTMVSLVVD
jgi:hypothetical protein